MEVTPGYKQTEVGVIPEDWEIKTINQLLEDKSILGHLDGNHGELYPRSSEFRQDGVPYIGANDFAEGSVTFNRCKFLSKERAIQFRKGVSKDGDVLFAHNATVGPVALLRTSEPFIILSTTATYFRCNEKKLNNIYLKSALQSQQFVNQYQAVMAQSTRFQVPITAQRKLSLIIPSLPEQHTISTVLSDVDALISSIDQLIAKKRDIKQAAMQELLTGKRRLPGFSGEWVERRIEDIATPTSIKNVNMEALPVLTCSKHLGFVDSLGYFKSQIFSKDTSAYKVILHDQIGYPSNHVEEGSIGLQDLYEKALVSPIYVVFTVNSGTSSYFLHRLLKLDRYRQKFKTATTSSIDRRGSLRWPEFSKIIVNLPSLNEQIAINKVISDMEAELSALEQKRDKTKAIKQGMMQELLTGRIRLV